MLSNTYQKETSLNIQLQVVDGLRFLILDNLYTELEMNAINAEIRALVNIRQSPRNTSTAVDEQGNLLKRGGGVFLDTLYGTNRSSSAILNANRKLFSQELNNKLCKIDASYRHLKQATIENTLINYYGNEDEYKPHRDTCTFTIISMFSIGSFTGGKFLFPEYDVALDHVIGRVVIFPGCVLHAVEPVVAEADNFRITATQLTGYRS